MASKYYSWAHGRVHYQKRGMGDPLVLVHDVYPGASHEEFSRNIDGLARRFTVYAVDLLGFGESDRPRYFYTAKTYGELIFDFLREEIGGSAYVMASGLSAGYAAMGVEWEDEWYRKLVLVSPRTEPMGWDGPRWMAALRRRLLTMGAGEYELATEEFSMRTFLQERLFHPKEATAERVQQMREYARRPGSAYPWASWLTRYLDGDLLGVLARVQVPVLAVWGKQSQATPVTDRVTSAARRGHMEVIDQAGTWVQLEQSAKVNALVGDYLEGTPFAA
ncbi:MAG TPA: alpha/beta fold hydrolase [Tepidisphaeraceae bacterium]|jgi:pimeloyl-ACP methyl ester carboxylesterase|nr:alpha/beta fold hydrolase [Tepidisphaeraceae bacterium]